MERHASLIKVGKKHFKLAKKRCVSAKIQKMIIHRDSLYDKWNKNCNDKITGKHYKKFRNCVVYEIRESKSEYFKNYFDQDTTSMKKIWSDIKKLSTPDNFHPGLLPQISVDGKDLKETKQIANAFNNFFVNAANTVNKDIPLTFKSPNDYLKIPTPNHYFYVQSQNLKLRTLLTL